MYKTWRIKANIPYLLTGLVALQAPLIGAAIEQTNPSEQEARAPAKFAAKDYSSLLGMKGFSDKSLNNHFKLYQGYVKNSQLILDELNKMSADGKNSGVVFSELRRRFGWEFNGMRLHELYFENLGGAGTSLDSTHPLHAALERDFGSLDAWRKDFINTGAMRGIGWAVLYKDGYSDRLINTWINEHDLGHLAGGTPILIMDVFEHAYLTDYELDRPAYIKAFMENVNWDVVKRRFPSSSES